MPGSWMSIHESKPCIAKQTLFQHDHALSQILDSYRDVVAAAILRTCQMWKQVIVFTQVAFSLQGKIFAPTRFANFPPWEDLHTSVRA